MADCEDKCTVGNVEVRLLGIVGNIVVRLMGFSVRLNFHSAAFSAWRTVKDYKY